MTEHTALITRLTTVEAEAREALRAARFALDDLASALETMRQLRAEMPARAATSPGVDLSVPAHALVIEHGPCGRPEVTR